MYDRIIAPILEGEGVEATTLARTLARGLGCELELLHVHRIHEVPAEYEGLPQYRYQNVVESWTQADARAEAIEVDWLAELADAVAALAPETNVTSRVVPAPLLRSLRDDHERVLVVAPDRDAGAEGLDPDLQELVRGGGVPVLLVPPGTGALPVRRILVALDGSPFACEVLAPAVELARATGARLSLVEVVSRHTGMVRLLHPAERSVETAERSLREARDRVPHAVGAVDISVVVHESPAGGILLEAHRTGADLVAMATHGRGGIRRLLLGSVAEAVVRRSGVPVLVYRPVEVPATAA